MKKKRKIIKAKWLLEDIANKYILPTIPIIITLIVFLGWFIVCFTINDYWGKEIDPTKIFDFGSLMFLIFFLLVLLGFGLGIILQLWLKEDKKKKKKK